MVLLSVWLLSICLSFGIGPTQSIPVNTEQCTFPNKGYVLTHNSTCFQTAQAENTPQKNLYFKYVETEYYHDSKYTYVFYHPKVELDCECTCGAFNGLCSWDTPTKEDNCDRHQTRNDSCTNFFMDGKNRICPMFHKQCCQIYFSINDPQEKLTAFRLDFWRTAIVLEKETPPANAVQATKELLRIPDWIDRIMIDPGTVLEVEIQLTEKNDRDLSDRWIYYSEHKEQFFTDVEINAMDEHDFRKMGWFQVKNNRINRIPKKLLEKSIRMDIKQCQGKLIYNWTWDATNYYHEGKLHEPKIGRSMNEVYGDAWHIERNAFFAGRPALVLKSEELPYVKLKVTKTTSLNFSASVVDHKTLVLTLFSAPPGSYNVQLGFIEYTRIAVILIDSTTKFPREERIRFSVEIEHHVACLRDSSNASVSMCVILGEGQHARVPQQLSAPNSPTVKATSIEQPAYSTSTAHFDTSTPHVYVDTTIGHVDTSTSELHNKADLHLILVPILASLLLMSLMVIWYLRRKMRTRMTKPSNEVTMPLVTVNEQTEKAQGTTSTSDKTLRYCTAEFLQDYLRNVYLKWTKIDSTNSTNNCSFVVPKLTHIKGTENVDQDVGLEQLLTSTSSDNRQKTFTAVILGDSGYGKTTLLKKIAHDWANGCEYLKCYKLTIFLSLRHLMESFRESLQNQLELNLSIDLAELSKMQGLLLLLDDFDEQISDGYLESILLRKEFSEATIIIAAKNLQKIRNEDLSWDHMLRMNRISGNESEVILSQQLPK